MRGFGGMKVKVDTRIETQTEKDVREIAEKLYDKNFSMALRETIKAGAKQLLSNANVLENADKLLKDLKERSGRR